ncbi:MAG: DUF1232 domain-containing protein [Chloroflexi bacterium]|nr:DUF1232 domain-containing protein [Chloroflexota bacterium]
MNLPQVELERIERAERFYSRLRRRVAHWLGRHHVEGRLRDYMLLLPDLFALLLRLMRDPRVDVVLKAQLILVSAYVISPIDLVPDFLMPIGLADDTVALAFILSRVVAMMGQAGEALLREYWEGEGDILAQIQRIVVGADALLNKRILARLRRRFGNGQAEK